MYFIVFVLCMVCMQLVSTILMYGYIVSSAYHVQIECQCDDTYIPVISCTVCMYVLYLNNFTLNNYACSILFQSCMYLCMTVYTVCMYVICNIRIFVFVQIITEHRLCTTQKVYVCTMYNRDVYTPKRYDCIN